MTINRPVRTVLDTIWLVSGILLIIVSGVALYNASTGSGDAETLAGVLLPRVQTLLLGMVIAFALVRGAELATVRSMRRRTDQSM
ncbi:hypothetical protein [Rhodococcus sp. IEGM 1374]|uniref:hypothetical protein n=1 Tax=Rhodococcus sp. IEGM 1374 TaxID=3082221 RepID=UPI002955787B|nr:hypothetical protein [Rhodococcus sp. IEGM 1374]MDV7991600.1 hypothetical protein [Rhodococcus sp. IEGM 1374]